MPTTRELFAQNLQDHQKLMAELGQLENMLEQAVFLVVQSMSAGGTLFLCGNGGSAADSQHLAAEFVGRLDKDRRPLAAVALTTDTSGLTCIANDYDYSHVFLRPLQALAKKGDCLLAISTSGNSPNVLKAVQAAREMGVKSVGLLGKDGGVIASQCDVALVVPSQHTARIQEAHILLGHTLCGAVELGLGAVA